MSTQTMSRITDITIDRTLETWEIQYRHNGEERDEEMEDCDLVRVLERLGQIQGFDTYANEYFVLTNTSDRMELIDFIEYECDRQELIMFIEKYK